MEYIWHIPRSRSWPTWLNNELGFESFIYYPLDLGHIIQCWNPLWWPQEYVRGYSCHWGAKNGGVVSWADHIQAIHSQPPILWSTKLLGQPKKNSQWIKNQRLQDEGVDCSSGRLGNSIENFGNLQYSTQMLSYKWLNFISFQGWSREGAWSLWLVPLVLHIGRKK